MDQDLDSNLRKPPTLCTIAEELRCHVLSFLSYTEIIRCLSTCQTMYKTVTNSTELQYLIELGAQRLMPVHPRSPTVSITECLHILRDKANAWSSFELKVRKRLHRVQLSQPGITSIIHQQLGLSSSRWPNKLDSKVIDLRTYTPETARTPPRMWRRDTANAAPVCFRLVDETQDLMVTVNILDGNPPTSNFMYQIDLRTIYTDMEHPLAQGSRLVDGRVPRDEEVQRIEIAAVAVLGDRLAFYGSALQLADEDIYNQQYWSLHVWNWHEGGDQLNDLCVFGEGYALLKICFLTKEKLLALTTHAGIELYNVEELSKPPQLQARFMLPVAPQSLRLRYPSVFHSASSCARLMAPDERWIWTTDPSDRVICVITSNPRAIFVIHSRLFFMDIPPTWFDSISGDSRAVPWSLWGPQNSRCFHIDLDTLLMRGMDHIIGVGGSRVIRAGMTRMYMTDFNPSAVARGIGKVVREPTTFPASAYSFLQDVTTFLPYVEVVNNDRDFDSSLWDIILDEEKALIFTRASTTEPVMDVEIIDM